MCLTGTQVKQRLWEQGTTMKKWAEDNQYKYRDVSDVVRGINRGEWGRGYEIAVKLGMKDCDKPAN